MRQFAGIRSDDDVMPDESSILNFRQLLERHGLTEPLFVQINTHLTERGFVVGKGTIVDDDHQCAVLDEECREETRPRDAPDAQRKPMVLRDEGAHGTDAHSGLVHTVQAAAANVADVNVMGELLHGNEDSLHGDSASQGKELKAQAEAAGVAFNVNERGSKHAPLTDKQGARNRQLSRVRAIVEHPFVVVKRRWGHTQLRYRGLAKNLAQMRMLFGLANIYRVRYRLIATAGEVRA